MRLIRKIFSDEPLVPLRFGIDLGFGPLSSVPSVYAACGRDSLAAEDGIVLSFSEAPGCRKSPVSFRTFGGRLKGARDAGRRVVAREVEVKGGSPIPKWSVVGVDAVLSYLWIVTTCMGRRSFVEKTISSMVGQPFAKYVLVDWSCPDGVGRWARERFPNAIVVDRPGNELFNLPAARNAGASVVPDGEWILFADCDIVIPPGFSRTLLPLLVRGTFLRVEKSPPCMMGTCVANQADWRSVGGYDELIRGYAGEDFDFYHALSFKGLRSATFPNILSHVDHDDATRVAGYEAPTGEPTADRKRRHMRHNGKYVDAKWDMARKLGRPLRVEERAATWESTRDPRVSFCTTCRDRLWQKDAFLSNLEVARKWDAFDHEFVLIDYGSQSDDVKGFVASIPRGLSRNLKYYRCEATEFKMPHAKNVAHLASTGGILMNLDFDNYLNVDSMTAILETVRNGRLLHDTDKAAGTHGRIALTREDFLRLRGYDESFDPMIFQDTDLLNRARANNASVSRGGKRLPRTCINNERGDPWRDQWAVDNRARGEDHNRVVNQLGFGRAELTDLNGAKRIIGVDALSSNPARFVLMVGLYRGQTPAREAELAKCRRMNLDNPSISEVHFLLEEEAARTAPELGHPKARLFELGRRATYEDFFRHASDAVVGGAILANADTWFDGALASVRTRPREIIAIRRDDNLPGQDAWIFEAPLPTFPCGHELGRFNCEFRMARLAKEAGIEVAMARAGLHHEHRSQFRDRLPGVDGPLYYPKPRGPISCPNP